MIQLPRSLFRCTVFLFVLCIHGSPLFAGERIDSLRQQLSTTTDTNRVNLLVALADEAEVVDIDLSLDYANRAFNLATALSYSHGMASACMRLSSGNRIIGKYETAIKWADISLKISKETKDLPGQGTIYNEMGIIYRGLGDYDQSLDYYIKASKIFDGYGDWRRSAKIKRNMAYLYLHIGEFESMKKNCLETLEQFEKFGMELSAATSCSCLGDAYFSLDDLDSAVFFYSKSLHILDKNNAKHKMISPLINMSMLYREQEDYNLALTLTKKAAFLCDTLGYTQDGAFCYQGIGEIFLAQKKLDSARFYFEKSGAIFRGSGDLLAIMQNYESTSEYFHLAGRDTEAYSYLLKYNETKDSLYSAEKDRQILEIKEAYETEKRQQEIARLKAEKEIKSGQVKLRNTLLISAVLLLIAFTIVVIFYIKRMRAKQVQHKIEMEQKVLRAQMNPHFIFNSLNSIQRMYVEGNLNNANDYLSDFGVLLRKILENSGKSMITVKEEVETLKLYLEMEKLRTGDKIDYDIKVADEVDSFGMRVPPLIIQPFVENAIWHGILPKGETGTITIALELHTENRIYCTVTDNGVGISNATRKTSGSYPSRGMEITTDRLGSSEAVRVERIKTGGTKVSLLIPVKYD